MFAVLVITGVLANAQSVTTQTFGSGTNQFSIDFVTIGDPGNAADTTGDPNPVGSVPYIYKISKYEVSREMVLKASALGNMGITLGDMSGYTSSADPNGPNRPASLISWNEAARFVNYLNISRGYHPAYKFSGNGSNDYIALWSSGEYIGTNQFRHKDAYYFLPSVDEWYKAAFGSPNGTWFNYANGSDSAPETVASGTTGVVCGPQPGPADINNAGDLSPYGTMGQLGNVWEWTESAWDGINNEAGEYTELRGGGFTDLVSGLGNFTRHGGFNPSSAHFNLGFRVASAENTPSVYTFSDGSSQTTYATELRDQTRGEFGRSDVVSVVVGSGVTKLGRDAFAWVGSLTNIVISDNVTEVGEGALAGTAITSINIPNSVTNIGISAFQACAGLTNVVIPTNVNTIGNYAFFGCSSLTNITIPSSVKSLGENVFRDCTNLPSINLPIGLTNIPSFAFFNCQSLTSVNIPNTVTKIGNNAFAFCTKLAQVSIPSSVVNIEGTAFDSCFALNEITIPSSVTSIGDGLFHRCLALSKIRFLGNAPSISGYNWDECPATVYRPLGSTGWGSVFAARPVSLLETQDGLVAYFPFNGNTNDESGNGNNGVVDGATLAADKYGNSQGCYYFGDYNKIHIPHSPNLAPNQGAVSLWVKANSWTTSDHLADLVGKDDNPSGRQWVLQIHGTGGDFPDGAVRAGVFTESGLGYGDSTVTLPTATWVHLVQVWNGTNVRVYFNGAKIIESSASGNMAAGTGPVSIGGNTGSSLDGWIDNVRIYNRALSVQEIKLIYGQEKPDTEAPVITLFGSDPIQVYKGSTFTDPGATVTDDIDETRSIFGSGSVDQSTLGTYTITYTATDALGNIAIPVTRTVNVVLDPNGDENGDGISNGVAVLLGYSPHFNFAPLIDYLKTNPVAGLFSQSQYDANRTNGQSDILNNPNANGLYTTNQIHNLGLGGIVLNRDTNNQLILNYQVMESTDLQNWFPYQTYQLPITNAPTNKMFLRVQSVGQ